MSKGYKELKTTCQKCGKEIEIVYNGIDCHIFERRTKTASERKRQAFSKDTILHPHGCVDACLFPNSETCCEYKEGSCKVGHCIDEVYYDNEKYYNK